MGSSPPTPSSLPTSIVDQVLRSDLFATHLEKLRAGESIILDHVAREAWSFAATLTAIAVSQQRVWILCPDPRTQEQIHGELPAWGLPSLFFPRLPVGEGEDALPDPDAQAERLGVLAKISSGTGMLPVCRADILSAPSINHDSGRMPELHTGCKPVPHPQHIIVICNDSLDEEVPAQIELDSRRRHLQTGLKIEVESLLNELTQAGYERNPVVTERGQFARRGGIVDVFPWQAEEPLRIEFGDDAIESLRVFDIHTQTSVQKFEQITILLGQPDLSGAKAKVSDYISPDDLVILIEPEKKITPSRRQVIITSGAAEDDITEDFSCAIFENPLGVFNAGDFVLNEIRRAQFAKQIEEWRRDDWRVVAFFHNEGEKERFEELATKTWITQHGIEIALGQLHRGFTVPFAKIAVVSGAEIFGRHQHTRRVRGSKLDEAQVLRQARDMLREMREGDLVVHADCGVGKFAGIQMREGAQREEVLVIKYADEAKVFVPLSQAHLVSRYVGVGGKAPPLNKIGDARWQRTRVKAERSVEEFAARMLSMQAQRQTIKGFAHPPDTKWQTEFEQSFLYRETPDQLRATDEIKRDMEIEKPMDRLLCGDVGFGKTEVAIRAAFKAVMSGRQVAVLVPTTVLAQQHWQTFRERMSDYPVTVAMLSRLTPPKKERAIIKAIQDGSVDIVIGTHRLISKDVHFKNLGLAVVDEEQRFGVKHKERFKEIFRLVDVLTLSATPIPRTLYLALMGMRDMSTLETPPPNRHPVATTVCGYDERIMRDAINLEIERGGQVFFLHNRVMSIEKMKAKIEALCPQARVLIGHGQMDATMLEDVMQTFVNGEADVLVCTTIIESGVDIPNANTIIIDRADRFGLADLYQLRGRVGRGGERAHAYLMLPRDLMTQGDARKRVNAIKQYTALGSGFKIAMRDLEIRGAGNLLGTEQSGHIAAVGFDLYCQMLKTTTARMQGRRAAPPVEVSLHTDFLCLSEAQFLDAGGDPRLAPAYLPVNFIEDARMRIGAYRALGEVMMRKELDQIERDWRDQFGVFPPAVVNLLLCAAIRLVAAHAGISAVEIKAGKLMLTRNHQHVLIRGKFPRLTATDQTLMLRECLQMLRNFRP